MISSLVTRTLLMRGSLLAAVFIPSLYNDNQMRLNDSSNNVQLPGVEAMIPSQAERLKAELAGLVLTVDVDVRRLIAVKAREEESIRAGNPFDSWHSKTPLSISFAS
jgi:hypothetical protein